LVNHINILLLQVDGVLEQLLTFVLGAHIGCFEGFGINAYLVEVGAILTRVKAVNKGEWD
jgi:hypothetical protein